MEEKFQRARLLENIERYLKFEGVSFNDELMVTIHTMLIDAKKELEPKKNDSAFNLMMDLLRRKIDFTSDNTIMKKNAYDFFMNETEKMAENENNIEKKLILRDIFNKFKNNEYTEFFDKFIDGERLTNCENINEKEYSQFEKNLQWIITLINESTPDQNGKTQYIDGGGVDWNSKDYFNANTIKEND